METAVQKAKIYLDARRGERVTLEELSRAVGASPFHLQRRFKQAFGISPRDYQDAHRVEAVKSSLKNGSRVTEALFDAGYGSTSRFYEKAASSLGMAARRYRASGRGEAAPADRRGVQRGGADRGSRGAGRNSRPHRFLPVGRRRSLAGPGGHPRHGVPAPRVAGAEPHPAGRDAHLRPDRACYRQPGRRARGGQRVRREPGGAGRPLPPRGAHRRRARRLRLGHRAEETTPGAGEADEEMRAADFGRLVALAAIWGASFLFTRIVAPVLGPALTADLRMLVAGLALVAYFRLAGFDPDWRRWGGKYAFVGLLNSGLPFLLFAYSALYLSAGLMAVLNATAPMWGALFTVLLLGERLSGRRAAGLALGVVGVAVLSRPDAGTTQAFLAIAACLAASFLYGLAGVYMKRWAGEVPARGMA